MKLRPVGWKVIVVEDPPQKCTVSGIFLTPQSVMLPSTGRVVGVSRAAKREHPELHYGLRVHFKPLAYREGYRLRLLGLNIRVVCQDELLAIVLDG